MSINLDIVLYILGLITSFAAASAILYRVFRSLVVKSLGNLIEVTVKNVIQNEVNPKIEDIDKLRKELDDFSKSQSQYNETLKDAFISLIREKINFAYNYYMSKGSIDPHSMSSLEDLFRVYTSFGGNWFSHDQMDELRELFKRTNLG